jgi:uncharacterized membrane protein (DUF485 family)
VSPQELAPETAQPTEGSFDWWSAPSTAREKQEQRREGEPVIDPVADVTLGSTVEAAVNTAVDPAMEAAVAPAVGPTVEAAVDPALDTAVFTGVDPAAEVVVPDEAAIYRAVHQSSEFREIRTRYRRFVFPATAAFLLWYLLYVVLAVSAPQLMARPVAGPFNTAWLLGLLQFASTFLLTWLYARHARAHRDRAALGLRWETQDRLR